MNATHHTREKHIKLATFLFSAIFGSGLMISAGILFATVTLPMMATPWAPLAIVSTGMLAGLAVTGLAIIHACLAKACCSPILPAFSADAILSKHLDKRQARRVIPPASPSESSDLTPVLTQTLHQQDRLLRLH